MRNEIIDLVNKEFKSNKNNFFLTADLGFSVLDSTRQIFKKNFINVGVAETNMILIASGICEVTKSKVYAYSISSFLTLRTLEVLRNYISNDKRQICLIGVGSGVSYDKMGKTHFNLDDINAIYSLKNILILNPANDDELKFLFHKFKKIKTPTYFRINKTPYKNTFGFIRKRNFFYKPGKKFNIIVSGAILNNFCSIFSKKELNLFNIISLPIFSSNYNKSFQNLLVKGKTLFIVDSAKTVLFEEMRKIVEYKTKKTSINFDFDHNLIKKVNLENQILKQMRFSKKNIFKLLY
jgi:deoxyxylulose-5-phosphate synthase